MTIGSNCKSDRLLMLQILSVAFGKIDGKRVKTLHRERREHEGHEQEEHHVDHRNDLDTSAARFTGAAKLHRTPPAAPRPSRVLTGRSSSPARASEDS